MYLDILDSVGLPCKIEQLTFNQIKSIQEALSGLEYPVGVIDGICGVNTYDAWGEFKLDMFDDNLKYIGVESFDFISLLKKQVESKNCYNGLYSSVVSYETTEETKLAIIKKCKEMDLTLKTQIAYVLATVELETNGTFQPIKEAYWLSENWRRKNLRYYPYYGRGYAQITWKDNYDKYSKILDVDLVSQPDKVMDAGISIFILVHGFKYGVFTGKRLSQYVNKHKTDYINARRCINGFVKGRKVAKKVGKIAKRYVKELSI